MRAGEKRELGFSARLTAFLLLAVFAALAAGCFLQYELTSRQMREQEQAYTAASADQLADVVSDRIGNVIERLYYIRMNQEFSDALDDILLGWAEPDDLQAVARIQNALSLHRVTEPLISSLYLYTPLRAYTDNTVFTAEDFSFASSELSARLQGSAESIVWGHAWKDPIFITHKEVVPVMYQFTVPSYSEPMVLVANIDLRALRAFVQEKITVPDTSVLLLDAAGETVFGIEEPGHERYLARFAQAGAGKEQAEAESARLSSRAGAERSQTVLQIYDRQLETNGRAGIETSQMAAQDGTAGGTDGDIRSALERWAGERWQTERRALANAPWFLVSVRSETGVAGRLFDLLRSLFVINVAVLALICAAVTLITRRMTRPIYELAQVMSRAGEAQYRLAFHYERKDEIGALASSFNDMLGYTRELVERLTQSIAQLKEEKERVRIEQLLKRRAELKALQAQINPHFLYNTLDSIRWKAEEKEAWDISQMTQDLAAIFRVGLSRGKELITLRDELLHVESYLRIQRSRYGSRLCFAVEVEEGLHRFFVVKLILQPLVENAIYHGIRAKGLPGTVRVSGVREGRRLTFAVEDDGAGIAPEALARLNAGLAEGLSVSREGYGIFNVNERIRLYFGEAYGLRLESRPGEGTRAVLTMPVIEEWEVENYVPYTDRR